MEEVMSDLKECPCGQVPTGLSIFMDYSRAKWGYAAGNCCGEWSIEFRNNYNAVNSDETRALASEAWNRAPRKQAPDPEP
jgi:hypothetical protein